MTDQRDPSLPNPHGCSSLFWDSDARFAYRNLVPSVPNHCIRSIMHSALLSIGSTTSVSFAPSLSFPLFTSTPSCRFSQFFFSSTEGKGVTRFTRLSFEHERRGGKKQPTRTTDHCVSLFVCFCSNLFPPPLPLSPSLYQHVHVYIFKVTSGCF